MRDLSEVRQDINAVDRQMAKLLEERMDLAKEVAEYKQAHQLPVFDKKREEEILAGKIREYAHQDQEFKDQLTRFFQLMMDMSKESQARRIVNASLAGYAGVPGSFGHMALEEFFGEEMPQKNYLTFDQVCRAIEKEEIRYGVLPIENSSTGIINDVFDLLRDYDLYILKETAVPVQHYLLGVPGSALSEIREVYSHAQGFAQSGDFFSEHPQWNLIPYYNTAVSAEYVASEKDPAKACVASRRAAEIYGLEVLQPEIQDQNRNFTRFVVIGKTMDPANGADQISLYFTLDHKPGSLVRVLDELSKKGLNMQRIESRPIKGQIWEYGFFVDIQGNLRNPAVVEALRAVQPYCRFWKVLGCYKKHVIEL